MPNCSHSPLRAHAQLFKFAILNKVYDLVSLLPPSIPKSSNVMQFLLLIITIYFVNCSAKRYGGIKWFKLNGDLRTRSEITYDWHENESRNRIVLNYDMSLEIRRARATDEGSYTCFDSSVNPAALLYIKLT